MVSLDYILSRFKLSDPYYIKVVSLIFLAYLSNALYADNYVFAADDFGYRCKDERFVNNSCASLSNSSDLCTEWIYDNPSSFVAEFQLACQEWKRTLVGTVHHFGNMFGLLVVGPLSDRWGRKMLLIITGILGAVFGIARSLSTVYWAYIVFEFLEGFLGDSSSAAFMLLIEIVAQENRVLTEMICAQGYLVGEILLSLAAWLLPDWKILLRVIYAPSFLFFIYIFVIDESPRWLLSKGRKDEAICIVKKMAKKSKSELDNDMLSNITYESDDGVSYVRLLKNTFRSRTLLKRFLICLVWWTTSTFVSFGMSINSVYLQGSKYINYSLTSLVTLPGSLLTIFLLHKYKRKTILLLSFLLAALFLIIQPFIPSTLPWLSVLIYMIGKSTSSAYFEITYIFTSELFPTYTRNSMHALCSAVGRIGSIIAPQTPLLMVYWHGLPSMLFGVASLVAGFVTLFATETSHEELPDTIRQAEALGNKLLSSNDQHNNKSTEIPMSSL